MDSHITGSGPLAAKPHRHQALLQRLDRGQSANSVGHRAKALAQAACAEGECLRQGQAASRVARRAEGSAVLETSFVSLTYSATAVSAHFGSDLPTDPAMAKVEEAAPGPAQGEEEGANAYSASAIFVSAHVTYSAASVALELLR